MTLGNTFCKPYIYFVKSKTLATLGIFVFLGVFTTLETSLEVDINFDDRHLLVRMPAQAADILEMLDWASSPVCRSLCDTRFGEIDLCLALAAEV